MSFQRQCDLDAHSQEGFLMKDEDELFFVHGMQDVDESWDQMTARSLPPNRHLLPSCMLKNILFSSQNNIPSAPRNP